ncbi:class I SAM-dependent methyltransferase [Saccharopolyspora sp. ID03-671]|uniref:class I SAM-dependent methyltransferase n=1 Tax=Saccharopolyspora sp. ID03-671 TaxID=3073066 RepID=UPI00324550E5
MTAELARAQRTHWQSVYRSNPHMYGEQPSAPARHAAEVFAAERATTVLELGSGHGRDSLHFAARGFTVHAMDFSRDGLDQLRSRSREIGVAERVATTVHDVRDPIPLPDGSVDGVFAHMLLCMALSTSDIHALVAEIRRVLRPGGTLVYTARHTGDAHWGTGIDHGDNIYEHGGFAVHFFGHDLVTALARGWTLREVYSFEEGQLPRRLWRITQTTAR